MANGASNVWTQMNYVPPRGQCNHKASILAARCPCLRFMLHPLKSSSSYECDGCAHHASFHSMENRTEDEIRKRWEQEAKDKAENEDEIQQRPRKRVRAIEYSGRSGEALGDGDFNAALEAMSCNTRIATKTRAGAAKKSGRTAGVKAKTKITELFEEDDIVVELD
ncbi:hypothetical protein T440DRAFT_487609 [Plenodomus tracheiphilus IPT5]|uniref:Uncharacterized protein n=1 Tax=Plenodomus tracheiphilus IPT5 TaxID=1408161 RepID=A0A6A7BFH9_9PLEO|nr:hypothetical protein T440DRAFT_487609 [Plenodomus tracheiphilus IPT5]